jgi:hypothetical protein
MELEVAIESVVEVHAGHVKEGKHTGISGVRAASRLPKTAAAVRSAKSS